MIPAEAVEAAEEAIRGLWDSGKPVTAHDEARAALEAAAPHMQRTITTAEELDALPMAAVVREPLGLIWEKQGDGEGGSFWVETGDEQEYQGATIALPATVLHEPQP